MGKGDHKHKSNRKKWERAQMPELAPTPRPKSRGKKRMDEIETESLAAIPALQARCRQQGNNPTKESVREARSPWWGCEAGKAMAAAVEGHTERLALWDAIQHMRRVVTSYDRALGAPNRHAACMRLLVPTDPLTATAETPPLDERTDEEKQRQATSALMALEGALGWTDKAAASEAKRVVLDDWTARDVEGLLSALRCVSDLVKGTAQRYRGRDIAC